MVVIVDRRSSIRIIEVRMRDDMAERNAKAMPAGPPPDPFQKSREHLRAQLIKLGCRHFHDDRRAEWWLCSVCGVPVFIEIPAGWPGPNIPLGAWLNKHLIPQNFSTLFPDEAYVGGQELRKICVYFDPIVDAANLFEIIRFRFKEIGVKCL